MIIKRFPIWSILALTFALMLFVCWYIDYEERVTRLEGLVDYLDSVAYADMIERQRLCEKIATLEEVQP